METTLVGDEWCSLSQHTIIFQKHGETVYCYPVDDLLKIIHEGFTAVDTSYQEPGPLRFKPPRDSFNRTVLPLEVMNELVKKVTEQQLRRCTPDVLYFLRHRKRFYHDLKNVLSHTDTISPVDLSRAIQDFFTSSGQLTIKRSHNSHVVTWSFRRKPRSTLKTYITNLSIAM